MKNPQNGYLVNINQANVAIDGKARIHKLSANQPPKCQIEKIEEGHGKLFATEDDCRAYCERNNIDYKGCDHCFRDFGVGNKNGRGPLGWLLALKAVEIGLLLALHYAFDFDWSEACAITAAVAIGLAVIVWSIGRARS